VQYDIIREQIVGRKELFYQISVNQRWCHMDEYIIQSSIR